MKATRDESWDIWEEENSKGIDFAKVLQKIKAYWPLSLLGALIMTGLALLYLYKANPVYNVKAAVLIQDSEKKGSGKGNMLNSLQDLGLLNGASNVNNEQMVITSYPLIEEVVTDLQLYLQFFTHEKIRKQPVYKDDLPFKATITNFDLSRLSKKQKDDLNYTLTWDNSGYNITSENQTWKGNWGTPLLMPFGHLILQPNDLTKHSESEKSFYFTVQPIGAAANNYANALTTEIPNKQTSIINLQLRTTLPRQGTDMLNALISAYQASTVDDNNQLNDSTLTFINERLSVVGKELDSIEIKIQGFKQQNRLTDLPMQSQALIDNMGKQDQELNAQLVQLSMVNSMMDYLVANRSNPRVIPASLVVNNPSIAAAIDNYNRLLTQKERLQLSATNDNPVIQNIDEQLGGLQKSIFSGLESIKLSLSTGISKMKQQNASLTGVMREVPAIERTFGDFTRQQNIKRELYLFLLQKREESLIAKSSTLSNSRVIAPARADYTPVSPKRDLILFGALILGLLAPFGIDKIIHLFNNKIRTRADLEAKTSLPVIGEIGHKNESELIVVSHQSRSLVAEQLRVLRANIQFLFTQKEQKVIMVTSTVSGEGKTFISSNLATVFALTNKKVVLMELDLRKPKVMKGLDISATKGFTQYVIGKCEIEDIIIPSGINENLFVIPAGAIPPNPSELILHERTEALFTYLRTNFDFIVIDTTPNIVSDAQLLGKYADATLFLVRLDYTLKEHIDMIQNLTKDEKLPRVNLVVNDIKPKRYGGSYYGYGYGYGYGDYLPVEQKKSFLKRLAYKTK